jgi:hypothetical protein
MAFRPSSRSRSGAQRTPIVVKRRAFLFTPLVAAVPFGAAAKTRAYTLQAAPPSSLYLLPYRRHTLIWETTRAGKSSIWAALAQQLAQQGGRFIPVNVGPSREMLIARAALESAR